MITKLIPTVNRFIPFTLVALCAIAVLVSPYKAFADTAYLVYAGPIGGGNADTVQTVNSVDLWANGDFHNAHGLYIFHLDYADATTIHGNPDWVTGGGATGVPPFTDNNLVTTLSGGNSFYPNVASPGEYVAYWSSGNTANQQSYCFFDWDGSGVNLSHCGTPPGGGGDPCDSGDTRICGFTPENGDVVTGPDVTFTLDAWLASQDLTGNDRIRVFLHNIDQNVLLLGFLSNNDKILLDEKFFNGEDGHFAFSTTTPLADGNYRIEAYIDRQVFFGWFLNPFAGGHQDISKQFIVGSSTFIGNLSQNGFNILNGTLASSTATSSLALVAQCNPLGSYGFNMVNCLAGLFIPDANQVNTTITSMRDGILTRLPWGYFTRFAVILSSTATSSLPSYTVEFAQNTASDTTTLSFDPGDMLAGGGSLVNSIHDPYNNKTLRDIFEPIVQLVVGLMVLFTIVADLTGSHKDSANSPGDVASKRRRS